MLDCGLTRRPARAARPARDASSRRTARPRRGCAKTVAPMRDPAEVMVLIDADMIVTRSLAELIAEAADGPRGRRSTTTGRGSSREWGELLDLGHGDAAPLRLVRPRASSAAKPAPRCCALLDDRQRPGGHRPDPVRRATRPTTRSCIREQDVLNAILCTRVDRRPRRRAREPARPQPPVRRPAPRRRGDAALRVRGRHRALRAPPLPPQAVARRRCTTGSTRACSRACCSAT